MTNIKNFEIVKTALLDKKEAIYKQIYALSAENKDEKTQQFKKVFADELVSYADVELKASGNGVGFMIGNKDLSNIYNDRYYDGRSFYFNTYATTIDTDFEYKRLIFNGKVAEKILYNRELIQETFDTLFSKKAELDALQEEVYAIEEEIGNQQCNIQAAKKDEVLSKLNGEGIEWNSDLCFEFNRQWTSYLVKKVKIVKATKSGKTVDLEVTYVQYDWQYDENGNNKRVGKEDRIVTHEGIKMEYVMGNFRDAIYKY